MFGDMAHLSVLERCTLHIFFSTLQSNLMGYSVPKPSKNLRKISCWGQVRFSLGFAFVPGY